MKHAVACYPIVLALLITGCDRQSAVNTATNTKLHEFFVKWLEGHHEKQIVTDAQGVGIAGNPTRLKAQLYGSKKHENGTYIVEVECKISIPPHGEITEYIAGMGDTEEKAVNDALLNFTLTTFHVVYKSFMNKDDPHQEVEKITIAGKAREMIMGDMMTRGNNPPDLSGMRPKIKAEIAKLPLSHQPHWIKLVYSQINGKPETVAVLLDDKDHAGLTSAIKTMDWPKAENVIIVKQFIVIK